MGLSIHYNGSFKQGASLTEMIDEIEDIAKINKWDLFIFERDFPENSYGKLEYTNDLYGILFSPPKCEPICMCFLSNGLLSSPIDLKFNSVYAKKPSCELMGLNSTKTQFAGIETHKTIIHLIDYLSKKYLDNFTLSDEGQYWETRDEKLLQEIFNRYDNAMDIFARGIENIPKLEGESTEDLIKRIYRQMRCDKKNL